MRTIGATRAVRNAGALLVLMMLGASGRADIREMSLFEKSGRAPLVVWGEVTDGEHRFAIIRPLDVIKCDIPERPVGAFRIAFRLDSFLRRPWEDRITFATGERVLLFLRKFTKEDGEKPEGDIYTLMWGAKGKDTLPPEGADATIDAVRRLAEIHEARDLERQAAMLKEAISAPNPVLAEEAFAELIKQGLGDVDMIPLLTTFFDNPRESLRAHALRLMRQILDDAITAGRAVPERQELADLIRGKAALDPSASFRVEAVRTLSALGGDGVRAFLQRLAREDPSQDVRYQAERSLLDLER